MSAGIGHKHHNDHARGHDHYPRGLMRWVKSTNQKDIGTMYLWFSFVMFLVGGFIAMMFRAGKQQ